MSQIFIRKLVKNLFFWYKYIRTFVRIVFLIQIYLDIHSFQNHALAQCDEYSNIPVIFYTNIHSYDIRVVLFHTNIFSYSLVSNIFGYSFISKSIQMSLSGSLALTSLDVLLVFSTQFSNGLARQYLSICKVFQCPSLQIWSHQQRVQRRLRWCSS